jgi:hypothetical protein
MGDNPCDAAMFEVETRCRLPKRRAPSGKKLIVTVEEASDRNTSGVKSHQKIT